MWKWSEKMSGFQANKTCLESDHEHGKSCRCGSDLTLLWLWCRPAGATLIQPLAWELAFTSAALKRKKKKDRMDIGPMRGKKVCWGFLRRFLPRETSERHSQCCVILSRRKFYFPFWTLLHSLKLRYHILILINTVKYL